MSNIEVRVADASSLDIYRRLRLKGLQTDPDAFGSTYAFESIQPQQFWLDRFNHPNAHQLLVMLDGQPMGLCVVFALQPEQWTHWRANMGAIFGVWVDPQARGQGVADALMIGAIEHAREIGLTSLVLEVGDENWPAIKLYERMGFEPTGRTNHMDPPREHITEHERMLTLA